MKINFVTKTIEVTKTFANKAANFGSVEYTMLLAAMRDLPDFQVTVKPVRKGAHVGSYKNFTYAQMEEYISACDNAGELMDEFLKLRVSGCSYFQVNRWFMAKCFEPQIFAA